MVQTIIRVASVVLLIIILANLWIQKNEKEQQQNKKRK